MGGNGLTSTTRLLAEPQIAGAVRNAAKGSAATGTRDERISCEWARTELRGAAEKYGDHGGEDRRELGAVRGGEGTDGTFRSFSTNGDW